MSLYGKIRALPRYFRRLVTLPQRWQQRLNMLETALEASQQRSVELNNAQQQRLDEFHARFSLLLDRLDAVQAVQSVLRKDHDASVAWLQQIYPEIVAAMQRKVERPDLDAMATDLFAALHREVEALKHSPLANDPGQSAPDSPGKLPASNHDAFYLDLERSFRGTREEVSDKLRRYLQAVQTIPASASVLDIGCGRGEWLTLLQEAGISAQGVDLNPINGSYCRTLGLNVVTANALDFLNAQPVASLGAVTAFHLVEHLPFGDLLQLTEAIHRALMPGGLLIYETPNPENLLVATRSFWLDPTHLRPLPPELLAFLVKYCGFSNVDIERLHPAPPAGVTDPALRALLEGPRDYAVLASKEPDAHSSVSV